MNNLYGKNFIIQERSSGYRSSAYALAELIDNSIDAGSTLIDIFLIDDNIGQVGGRTSIRDILICDNGSGMHVDILNGCLRFAEGEGRTDGRIGAFGVGLPKASISVARTVKIYSKTGADWHSVFLDIDDQLRRDEPGYDDAIKDNPLFSGIDIEKYNTIIHWSNLDRIDYKKGSTLKVKYEKLFGRIYRYLINDGLHLKINLLEPGARGDYSYSSSKILTYDPLFLTPGLTHASNVIWDAVNNPKYQYRHVVLGEDERYNSVNYYRKYLEGYSSKESGAGALFSVLEDYSEEPYSVTLNGKSYKFTLKVAYAPSDITNPGLRNGGDTLVGRMLGEKMDGSVDFKSGNIYFMRSKREIDFGNFGFYKASDPKNRFWSIEVHFDSDLDELMGLANNKQSVQFGYTPSSAVTGISRDETLTIGACREHLWQKITEKVQGAINEIRKIHNSYARNFKESELADLNLKQGLTTGRMPAIEPTVISVLPQLTPWLDEEVDSMVDYLKSRFPHLESHEIKHQVKTYANGLTKTLVLYAPSQSDELFELVERRGKEVTLINSNHIYYQNIIQPMKSHSHLKLFATTIEMLLSSMSLEMYRLKMENAQLYSEPLSLFNTYASLKLKEFIQTSGLKVDVDKFVEDLEEYVDVN